MYPGYCSCGRILSLSLANTKIELSDCIVLQKYKILMLESLFVLAMMLHFTAPKYDIGGVVVRMDGKACYTLSQDNS